MLVLVAATGRSFELDASPTTRVDIVQRALESLAGVPVAEQVLISSGTRLDPGRELQHYGLPSVSPRQQQQGMSSSTSSLRTLRHVFLFSKDLLRGGTGSEESRAPPPIEPPDDDDAVAPPPYDDAGAAAGPRHPLDNAPSPLLRALPDYQRRFRHHLGYARALWGCSQARLATARRLVAEQHVQALAIDSARENVEAHYEYIVRFYKSFVADFERRRAEFRATLSRFPQDLERLQTIPTVGAATAAGFTSLADCVNAERLRGRAAECEEGLARFEVKVQDLGSKFVELQQAVEALMMTGPDIDIGELDADLRDASAYVEEQTAVTQSLQKDLETVERMAEETLRQLEGRQGAGHAPASLTRPDVGALSASQSMSASPLDNVAALDPMNALHASAHLPQIESCDAHLDALARRCHAAKAAMTAAVHSQLRDVSRLQGRIRDMKRTVTLFGEVMSRQASAFDELRAAARAPAAFSACLAECARRRAFQKHYAAKAAAMAEALAVARAAEADRASKFARSHERYLPRQLLDAMGLYATPPGCDVSVPPADGGAYGGAMTDTEMAALPADLRAQAEAEAKEAARAADARAAQEAEHNDSAMAALASDVTQAEAALGKAEAELQAPVEPLAVPAAAAFPEVSEPGAPSNSQAPSTQCPDDTGRLTVAANECGVSSALPVGSSQAGPSEEPLRTGAAKANADDSAYSCESAPEQGPVPEQGPTMHANQQIEGSRHEGVLCGEGEAAVATSEPRDAPPIQLTAVEPEQRSQSSAEQRGEHARAEAPAGECGTKGDGCPSIPAEVTIPAPAESSDSEDDGAIPDLDEAVASMHSDGLC